jgi:type II secretory pathway pseudopilin PulG
MKSMKLFRRNKLESFSLIELITAMIISGVVIVLVFTLLNRIQQKLEERKALSAILADRSIQLKHQLKLLHQQALSEVPIIQNAAYVTLTKEVIVNQLSDTLMIQLQNPELQKFHYGFKD